MGAFVVEVFVRNPVYVTVEATSPQHAEDTVAERLSDPEAGVEYLAEIVRDHLETNPPAWAEFEFGTALEDEQD